MMFIFNLQLNIRYLNPLFLAYDDRLRDRDEAIKKFQVRQVSPKFLSAYFNLFSDPVHEKTGATVM